LWSSTSRIKACRCTAMLACSVKFGVSAYSYVAWLIWNPCAGHVNMLGESGRALVMDHSALPHEHQASCRETAVHGHSAISCQGCPT
jgi:hypothetical protein